MPIVLKKLITHQKDLFACFVAVVSFLLTAQVLACFVVSVSWVYFESETGVVVILFL